MVALALAATVRAQGSVVAIQMEVTTALVQSSITIEAIEKANDAKCRELQARINALSAQVRAGKAQKADLVLANQALVAQLSETDSVYKVEIAAYGVAVSEIASTPDRLAALARFNAGDQIGALVILDKLQKADEVAKQTATNIEAATGERHIAILAYEAFRAGNVDAQSVLARYERVTHLDSGVFDDWQTLAELYADEGRLEEASRSAQRALDLLPGVAENKRAAVEEHTLGDLRTITFNEGDLTGALKASTMMLDLRRRAVAEAVAAGDVSNQPDLQAQVSFALDSVGDVLLAQRNLADASKAYEESLTIVRLAAAAQPGVDLFQIYLSSSLARVGKVRAAQGDLAGARSSDEEGLGVARRLVNSPYAAGPHSSVGSVGSVDPLKIMPESPTERLITLENSLYDIADVMVAHNDLASALSACREALSIARSLAASRPPPPGAHELYLDSRNAKGVVVFGLDKVGDVLVAQGDLAGAQNAYSEALGIARQLGVADPNLSRVQRDVGICLSKLAALPGAHVSWTDAAEQWESMQQRGTLLPADQHYLAEARQHAAQIVTHIGPGHLEIIEPDADHAGRRTDVHNGI
jgi:tetratricopeptide (TPR) repeat protein